MSFAEDDDMVKTLPPDRANQPFRMAILPWRSRRGGPITNAHGAKPLFEYFAIDTVAIAEDVPRHRLPAVGLNKLPPSILAMGASYALPCIWRPRSGQFRCQA